MDWPAPLRRLFNTGGDHGGLIEAISTKVEILDRLITHSYASTSNASFFQKVAAVRIVQLLLRAALARIALLFGEGLALVVATAKN